MIRKLTIESAAPWHAHHPRMRGERGEGDAVLAVRLLDARRVQVFQDHGREVVLPVVADLGLGEMVDEFVILVDAERAVWRYALDSDGRTTRTMPRSS